MRFRNVYGPFGTYDGDGKGPRRQYVARLPKPATAMPSRYGATENKRAASAADHREPINLGRVRMVSINQLAQIVIEISGKRGLTLEHVPGPEGVRGRNSDITTLRKTLEWELSIPMEDGLVPTYDWIDKMVSSA